jgi:hypothetical protein
MLEGEAAGCAIWFAPSFSMWLACCSERALLSGNLVFGSGLKVGFEKAVEIRVEKRGM